jgi:hypothetical protein
VFYLFFLDRHKNLIYNQSTLVISKAMKKQNIFISIVSTVVVTVVVPTVGTVMKVPAVGTVTLDVEDVVEVFEGRDVEEFPKGLTNLKFVQIIIYNYFKA